MSGTKKALCYHVCGEEACPKSYGFGPAVRPHYLLHFIISGCGYFQHSSGTNHLSKNQGFLILPGEVTYYEADRNTPWRYCWVGFDGTEVEDILANCGLDQNNRVFSCDAEKISQILQGLREHRRENEQCREFLQLSAMYQLFAQMRSYHAVQALPNGDYVNKACEYIRRNYAYPIRVSELAKQIGIDRSYLYKLFVQELNCSPQQYLLVHRLGVACGLLTTSQLSLTEIVYSCGFHDPATFIRAFKKRYGVTPGKYRRKNLNFTTPVS